MATDELEKQQELAVEDSAELEHPGGGRFNRLLFIVVGVTAMVVGVVAVQGIRSAGVRVQNVTPQPADSGTDTARNKAEVERSPRHQP
jgi:hypothetical protein